MLTATRYHDISCAHRVVGHEGACANIHGHNYRFTFHCRSKDDSPDKIGRVIDFGIIKSKLCVWLEDNWDHKLLIWVRDPILSLTQLTDNTSWPQFELLVINSSSYVPFNTTAENMAKYMVEEIAPKVLPDNIELYKCEVEETRKCKAIYER